MRGKNYEINLSYDWLEVVARLGLKVKLIAATIANSNIKLAINIHILWLVYNICPIVAVCPVSAILLSQLLLDTNIILAFVISKFLLIYFNISLNLFQGK